MKAYCCNLFMQLGDFYYHIPHFLRCFTVYFLYSAGHANCFGLPPTLSESRPPQRAGSASLSNLAHNAGSPCHSKPLHRTSLPVILLASCWQRHFLVLFVQEDGAGPPVGGQSSWPHSGGLSVCLQWFYSARSVEQRGVTQLMWHCQRWFHWGTQRAFERRWWREPDV